jgi:hypothetical protein
MATAARTTATTVFANRRKRHGRFGVGG